jgi:hypothetical protein
MLPGSTGGSADLTRLVEEKLRNWKASTKTQPPRAGAPPREVHDFVTISRMVGTAGHAVATGLGERLGWPVFDREILHVMADDDRVREKLYEALDERDVGWIEDMLRWLVDEGFDKEHYFHRLSRAILALARQGPVIFLGRGADLILPRNRGLRVGLVAPLEHLVRSIAARDHLSEVAARAEVDRLQSQHDEFLRSHFGGRADNPARHDLVINVATIAPSQAVELILAALRLHGMVR